MAADRMTFKCHVAKRFAASDGHAADRKKGRLNAMPLQRVKNSRGVGCRGPIVECQYDLMIQQRQCPHTRFIGRADDVSINRTASRIGSNDPREVGASRIVGAIKGGCGHRLRQGRH